MFVGSLHQFYSRFGNEEKFIAEQFVWYNFDTGEIKARKRAEERQYTFGASELQDWLVCLFQN